MRLFVCEFITGGGLYREPISSSLLQQGTMMRDAILRDFAHIAEMQLICARDMRLPSPAHCQEVVNIAFEDDVWEVWQREIDAAEAVLVLAPEAGGALLRLTHMVERSGKLLLGCHSEAVRIFGDKWLTFQHLQQHQIPTPSTFLAKDWLDQADKFEPQSEWIAKPIDGAGAEDMLIGDVAELKKCLSIGYEGYLVQPYLTGQAGSFCMLCRADEVIVLSANLQHIQRQQQHLHLFACELNAIPEHLPAFELLARQIAISMPNLSGYMGVDVLIQAKANKMHYAILDINPRLTTSYVGLDQAMQRNPAQYLLAIKQPSLAMPTFAQQRVMVNIAGAIH